MIPEYFVQPFLYALDIEGEMRRLVVCISTYVAYITRVMRNAGEGAKYVFVIEVLTMVPFDQFF